MGLNTLVMHIFAYLIVICISATTGNEENSTLRRLFPGRFGRKQLAENFMINIVSGSYVGMYELPYQLSLQNRGEHYCGAAILSKNFAVTAAHCVFDAYPSSIVAVAGEHILNSDDSLESYVGIRKILIHKNFNKHTYAHDIALLKFRKPLEFSEGVQPIALPPKNKRFGPPAEGLISGWGTTDSKDGYASNELRKATVPLINPAECRRVYGRRFKDDMLCAGHWEGGSDSCQGDSGGPMVLTEGSSKYLIGVVSWGKGCGMPRYPGVYADVTKHLQWIQNNTGIRSVNAG